MDELRFCELCGFMDDGTNPKNALSANGFCPFCEQAYRRGREDAGHPVPCEHGYPSGDCGFCWVIREDSNA